MLRYGLGSYFPFPSLKSHPTHFPLSNWYWCFKAKQIVSSLVLIEIIKGRLCTPSSTSSFIVAVVVRKLAFHFFFLWQATLPTSFSVIEIYASKHKKALHLHYLPCANNEGHKMGYCRILFQISNGQAHPMNAYTSRIFICSGNKKNLKSE